jgi:site-specific recombinase XerD
MTEAQAPANVRPGPPLRRLPPAGSTLAASPPASSRRCCTDDAPTVVPEPAAMPWAAAVGAFLSESVRAPSRTRDFYRRHLERARGRLRCSTLGDLTAETLAAYRAALLEPGAYTHRGRHNALCVLRSFLRWTGARGWHLLPPAVVEAALASPRAEAASSRTAAAAVLEGARRADDAGGGWLATVDAFLAAVATSGMRRAYRRHLANAAAWLGCCTLAKLTCETLVAYRATLLQDGREWAVHAQALTALRAFLLWTAERGFHALPPATTKDLLRHQGRLRPRRLARRCSPEWAAAVESFLASSFRAPATLGSYRAHLSRAGAALRSVPLSELTGGALVAYRAALLRDGRAPASQALTLMVLRVFLLWAAAQALHPLESAEIRETLRLLPSRCSREWEAAVESFLANSFRAAGTLRSYRAHLLSRAAAPLRRVPLSRLNCGALVAYRAALLEDGRAPASQAQTLKVLRLFLLWTAAQALHPLKSAEIRETLRLRPRRAADDGKVDVS